MKHTTTILLLSLLSLTAYSQKIDSLTFSKLSEALLKRNHPSFFLNEEDIEQGYFKRNNCIYNEDSPNYPFFCIENSWNKNWVTDFNDDDINDIIIKTAETIIPSETKNFHLLILDDKLNINKTYILYSGELEGHGDGELDIDSLKNGHIYARLWNNELFEDRSEQPKPFQLDFFIKNKRIQEKNYSKCKLYTADKKMFRKTKKITESFSFDKYYNEKKTESLFTKQNNYYKASFSGCHNKVLTFNYTNTQKKRKTISKTAVKEEWLKHISFLSKTTKFKNLFQELKTKLITKQFEEYTYNEYYNAHMNITLKNKQEVYLDFMFVEYLEGIPIENDITIKITSPEESELFYWDIVNNKFSN